MKGEQTSLRNTALIQKHISLYKLIFFYILLKGAKDNQFIKKDYFNSLITITMKKVKSLAQFDENGKLIVDWLGRTEFQDIREFEDGSTSTEANDIEVLTEKDGSAFIDWLGRKKFSFVWRYKDGSTETEVKGIVVLTEKDGKPFTDYLGRKKFKSVCRYKDGVTDTEANGIIILTNKEGKQILDWSGRRILTEKIGITFVDCLGREEFDEFYRYDDRSTETITNGIEVLTDKKGKQIT